MSTNGRTQIVILGAGFGGVYTAMDLVQFIMRRAPTVSHVEHGEHPSHM